MQIPQSLLELVIASPSISQTFFQQSVRVQLRLLGVDLFEHAGEQIRHLLTTWTCDLDQYASRGRRTRDPPVKYDTSQVPSILERRPAYGGSSHPPVQHPASQDPSTLC